MNRHLRIAITHFLAIAVFMLPADPTRAGGYHFGVAGDQVTLNGEPFKVLGLRCSNALVNERATRELIEQFDTYRDHGINTVSVYVMGSRFGDVKGYRPDATLDPIYAERLIRVVQAADERGMVVLVGCLYWGTSQAKADLEHWTQADAERAVSNTVKLLIEHDLRNIFIDPDNEGMAHREMGWDIAALIDAAHAVDPTIMVAFNHKPTPLAQNADLYIHWAPPVPGKPWIDTEASPQKSTPGGYWNVFSKESHQGTGGEFYNYSRVGRYSEEMKQEIRDRTLDEVDRFNGFMFTSTWLQAGPAEGLGGPFHTLGGYANQPEINREIDRLSPDAGVRWWAEFVRDTYGPWRPPPNRAAQAEDARTGMRFIESDGVLSIEAEGFHAQAESTYSAYSERHRWAFSDSIDGHSGHGYMVALPDERGEDRQGPPSPRDASGARLDYHVSTKTGGVYYVWVRGRSLGAESNGLHVGIGGTLPPKQHPGASNMTGFRPHDEWVWEQRRKEHEGYPGPAKLIVPPGDHTLSVWNRDDGFRFDKLVLVHEKVDLTMTGAGPQVSNLIFCTPEQTR